MPGWLWVVLAVVLGLVIFLLLRTRGGSGRHRAAPVVEYIPPEHEAAEHADDVETLETGEEVEEVEVPDEDLGFVDIQEPEPVPVEDLTPEETRWEEEWEERAEDAELRHDEGYVETFANEPTVEPVEPVAEPVAVPAAVPVEPAPAESIPADEVRESEYGAGSAVPGRSGAGPEGWKVKGNADSLLYYTEDAPTYARSAADVWFETEEAATSAGFTRWDAHHR